MRKKNTTDRKFPRHQWTIKPFSRIKESAKMYDRRKQKVNDNKLILNCSSAGDKRFSALYARVRLWGETKTIEEWYQTSKVFIFPEGREYQASTWREGKGKKPVKIRIGGKELPVELLSEFYYALWYIYLKQNSYLVKYLKEFEDFVDPFARPGCNSQAEAIRRFLEGKEVHPELKFLTEAGKIE